MLTSLLSHVRMRAYVNAHTCTPMDKTVTVADNDAANSGTGGSNIANYVTLANDDSHDILVNGAAVCVSTNIAESDSDNDTPGRVIDRGD